MEWGPPDILIKINQSPYASGSAHSPMSRYVLTHLLIRRVRVSCLTVAIDRNVRICSRFCFIQPCFSPFPLIQECYLEHPCHQLSGLEDITAGAALRVACFLISNDFYEIVWGGDVPLGVNRQPLPMDFINFCSGLTD